MAEIRINATGGVKLYDADDSHYAQIVAGTITSNTDVMTLGHAAVVMGTKLDMNGSNLVLDADADTYLDTGTDDTIKVYVSGAHDLTIGANAINVLSGTTLTIDSGATITNSGTANGFSSADPSSADGDTLGTASAEWSDLYLADGGVIYFGNDQEITLTHNADDGLLLKHVGTGDGKEPSLTFQAGDNDIAQDDVLGSIFFQAPDEGAGTDAVLVAAGIEAVSEGDFSSSNNATKLSFKTAASEAAAEKMTLSSGGNLDVTGDVTGSTINADGDTSSGDNAAIGYTAAEGLILTGQGSTNDVTLKNDADTTVLEVATGTVNVELTAGNLIMGTSGKGIDFSATGDAGTSGSTMENELLDDYEEGTWTISSTLQSGSVTHNSSINTMKYVKIGQVVHITGYTAVSSVSSPSGTMRFAGLPFSAGIDSADGSFHAAIQINNRGHESDFDMLGYVEHGGTTIVLSLWNGTSDAGGAVGQQQSSGSHNLLGGSYFAAT